MNKDMFKKSGVVTFEECVRRQDSPHGANIIVGKPTHTHFYLASGAGREASIDLLFKAKYKNILISYFYLRAMLKKYGGSMKAWIEEQGWNMKGIRLMIDSGAYSAKTQGKPIDNKEYLAFVEKNLAYISIPIMMDEVLNPEGTKKNFLDSIATGIDFMYVFHRPEPWKFFDYARKHAKYIGLAPMPKSASGVKIDWFGKCLHRAGLIRGSNRFVNSPQMSFDYVRNSYHLLGSGGKKVLSSVDAVSADASSWAMMVGVHAVSQTPYGGVCWYSHRKDKSNCWHNIKGEQRENIEKWIWKIIRMKPKDLLVPKNVSMHWTPRNGHSPNLPLALLNIEYAKIVEKEINEKKQKEGLAALVIPAKPDFSVVDNIQMEGVKWA